MPLPKGVDAAPGGRFRARFMHNGRKHQAYWDTPKQAEAWMQRTRRDLALGIHEDSPDIEPATGKKAVPLFKDYAADWVAGRDLKPSTRASYARMVEQHLAPEFGKKRLDKIRPDEVAAWHRRLLPGKPTMRAHVYGLLRSILNSAYSEDLIPGNPCKIKGAGQAKRASHTELPTVEQVNALAAAMPGPKYRTMTLLAAWCGLRFGELTELRRKDIVVGGDGLPVVVKVRRAVYRDVVSTPKSSAGVRDIAIPPHIRPAVQEWLAGRPKAADSLLFPATRTGGHIKPSSLYKAFYAARETAGVPTLRWHDLRHFAGTTVAQTGATLREIQDHLGHSTVNAAMKYQHTAQGRGAEIAEAMSRLAAPKPAPAPEPEPDLGHGTADVAKTPEPVADVVPIRPAQRSWMTMTEVARSIQLTIPQLRKIIARGELQTVEKHGRKMILEADLDAFLAKNRAEWG